MLYYGCIPKFSFSGCLNCNDTKWCGGGGGVVVFLPIIIQPQQSCFKLFCVVGWVVATIYLPSPDSPNC